jgi:mRNA interferase MazF
VVARALERERRRVVAGRDAAILARTGEDPELAGLATVTVAPITSTIRGLSTEVPVDATNGLEQPSVVSLDHVTTIPAITLGPQIGQLFDRQEAALSQAIHAAFDLD